MNMWSPEIDELGMLNESKKGAQCSRIIRMLLISFMIAILVGAVTILTIGIWTHEVSYGSKALAGLIGQPLYRVDSVILIVGGAATLIVISIGLVGLLLPQKCLLGLHLSIITFVAFALFTAGILGFVFVGELEDSVRGTLKKSLTEKYGLEGESSVTKAWDNVQSEFDCCGAYGSENTSTSWHLYAMESFWFKDGISNGKYVPDSCCQNQINIDLCTGLANYTEPWPPRVAPPVLARSTNYTLYTVGCFDKLKSYLEQNGILIGTAAVVVGVFMIVEVVLTGLVYRTLH